MAAETMMKYTLLLNGALFHLKSNYRKTVTLQNLFFLIFVTSYFRTYLSCF